MEYTWSPSEDSGLSGSVVIDIPTLKEQFKLIREVSITPTDGKMDISSQLDVVEKQVENCAKHIKSVKLKHIKSGKEIKSLEDMLMYKQTREIVIGEISSLLMNGIDLGKT
jgi:hypothetical protein